MKPAVEMADPAKVIPSSDRREVMLAWLWTGALNAFAVPLAILLPEKIRITGDKLLFVSLLFPVCGLVLLVRAIRATLRYRKFGDATFKVLSLEGAIGGVLSGFIVTNAKVDEAQHFHLVLRCIQRVVTGSGKNRRVEERVLWEDWRDVKELANDPVRSGIPVLFEVPSHCAPTNASQSISWKLDASAENRGIDFATSFDVPMACMASPQSARMDSKEFERRYGEPTDMAALLSKKGVQVHSSDMGIEMRISAARHKGMALLFTALTAGFVAVLATFVKPVLEFANVLAGGILVTFIVFFSFMLATLWGVSSRIQTDGAVLHLTRRWFGIPCRTNVPREKISSIDCEVGLSSNSSTYFSLLLMTVSGKKITLAYHIRGQREANWLAAELRRSLQIT